MKGMISDGKTVTTTAPAGGYTAGVGVLLGALFGVALNSAAEGETCVLSLHGACEHAKSTGAGTGGTLGALAYFDSTTKTITASETDNVAVGCFGATCADGDDVCEIILGVNTRPGATS